MSAGTVIAGPVVSTTVTSNEALDGFPVLSAAEHVTVVVSIADVAENATAAPSGPVASTVMLLGTETAGAVVSRTVTSNESLDSLPCASVAEHVTVVASSANVEPDAGSQTTATSSSTASVAVA